uniref:Uncharacterized protein n=1 Tax=viral metagenome TaxID=1070528 RepID=A0A6C0L7D4_9ZZZZ
MSSQTFSRSVLQGIPEQRKQQDIDGLIERFIHELLHAAAMGKTSYMYQPPHDLIQTGHAIRINVSSNPPALGKTFLSSPSSATGMNSLSNTPLPVITIDDLVSAFQKKFPDCDVSYQETWVDIDSNNRSLKKGILIDWS